MTEDTIGSSSCAHGDPAAHGPLPRRVAWPIVFELAAVAAAIGAQLALFTRAIESGTSYDEGTYLASLDDLRAGQDLGTEVFAAQPPGFYLGLRLAALAFGNSVEGVRVGVLIAFVVGAVGVYLLARSLSGRLGGLLAVALVGVAPPVPLFAVRVLADLPSLGVMFLGLGVGSLAPVDRRWRTATAFAAGGLLAVAMFVKPTAAVGIVPLAILLSRQSDRRRAWGLAIGGMAITTIVFLAGHLGQLHALWKTVVVYRRRAAAQPSLLSHRDLLEQVLNPHAAFTWLVVLAVIAAAGVAVRMRSLRPLAPVAAPASLLVLAAVAIETYRPLHANHVVLLSEALVVVVATTIGSVSSVLGRRPATALTLVATVLVLGAYLQARARIDSEYPPENPALVALAGRLAAVTEPGSLVVSDQPIVAYLASRETPGNLVDIADLRFLTGTLSNEELLREIDERCIRAVVIGRALSYRPELIRDVDSRFRSREQMGAGTLFWGPLRPCG